MRARIVSIWILTCVGLAGAWASVSGSDTGRAKIGGLEVKVEEKQLVASFHLDNAFDKDFRRRIESGLPTDLVFRFQLSRERRTWFDKSVARGSLQVVAMYNSVTEEYLVNFKHDGNLIESRIVRDVKELRGAMTHFVKLPVFSTDGRDPQERLTFRVRADLGTRTMMAFIPRTVHTEWLESPPFRLSDRSNG